jgi:hypothetical protein
VTLPTDHQGESVASSLRDKRATSLMLGREIDEIVYKLYGLTSEEITIIEKSAPVESGKSS